MTLEPMAGGWFRHPNALVESTAIGAQTRVWAFAHILPGATIGVTAYRSDARNFIERPQGAPQFVNAERYRLQGIEVEAAVRAARGLLARGRYTYLYA